MEDRETKIIDDYVAKMLEVQKERFEQPLNLNELKEIAYSIGMSESDWQLSQEMMAQHVKTGQAHLKNRNWEDAVAELKQAVAINPFHEEGLFGLAVAFHEKYKKSGAESDKTSAKEYAERALKNDNKGLDSAAIALLNDIRASQEAHQKKKTAFWLRIAAAAGIFLVVVLLIMYTVSSTISGKASTLDQEMVKVEQAWGQVENVYQRRESLIPQIVNLYKSASKYDQSKLEELQNLQKGLNPSNRDEYRAKQDQISKKLTELMGNMQANAETLRDVQVQIEGSENRIRVEWKKYNDVVAEYNNAVVKYNDAIKGFPANMMGYKAKEKIKAEIKK